MSPSPPRGRPGNPHRAIQRALRAPAITSRRPTPSMRSCQSGGGGGVVPRSVPRRGGPVTAFRPWRRTLRRDGTLGEWRLWFVAVTCLPSHKWSNNRCGWSQVVSSSRRDDRIRSAGSKLNSRFVVTRNRRVCLAVAYSSIKITRSTVYNFITPLICCSLVG